jgi:predicted transcriptional regulator
VNKESFTNSDTYMRRVYYSYFLNKTKTVEAIKAKLSKDLNGKLALKNNEKLNSATVVSVMKTLLPQVDATMKKELLELVEKRKEKYSGALPLPG